MEFWKQTALSKFPAMTIIPTCEVLCSCAAVAELRWPQVALLVLGIVATGLLFDEFSSLDPTKLGLFWLSVCVSAVGIYFLCTNEARKMTLHMAVRVCLHHLPLHGTHCLTPRGVCVHKVLLTG